MALCQKCVTVQSTVIEAKAVEEIRDFLFDCVNQAMKTWIQVAERLGNRACNLKVASSIPGRAK